MGLALRPLGATGLEVTVLGFGAMQAGAPGLDDATAGRLLNTALDLGIRLIDTARSYGLSEERIGRHLAWRRDGFLLSTKVGYGVEGVEDWTPECVRLGIEAARSRLATDVIDIVHLHSCDAATLTRPGLVEALEEAAARGVVRVAAYSGDNAAADLAARSGRFGVMQTSLNLCDQRAMPAIRAWSGQGIGVLAKRPLAGLPWRAAASVPDGVHDEYRRRFEQLAGRGSDRDWVDFALRFAAYTPGVAACLVGGTDARHLAANVAAIERGPLPAGEREQMERAFASTGRDWPGLT